jgi:starch synthase
MISLRYGTIPLVFKTGGLADTVAPFDSQGSKANGFIFDKYTKEAFIKTIKIAVETFRNKKVFNRLITQAFSCDYSWEKSAQKYKKLYQKCLSSA